METPDALEPLVQHLNSGDRKVLVEACAAAEQEMEKDARYVNNHLTELYILLDAIYNLSTERGDAAKVMDEWRQGYMRLLKQTGNHKEAYDGIMERLQGTQSTIQAAKSAQGRMTFNDRGRACLKENFEPSISINGNLLKTPQEFFTHRISEACNAISEQLRAPVLGLTVTKEKKKERFDEIRRYRQHLKTVLSIHLGQGLLVPLVCGNKTQEWIKVDRTLRVVHKLLDVKAHDLFDAPTGVDIAPLFKLDGIILRANAWAVKHHPDNTSRALGKGRGGGLRLPHIYGDL
ncbi:hypothetical protein JCM11491_006230 [Sporobolomyces phaffii]